MSFNIYWGDSINESNPFYAALSPEDKAFLLPGPTDESVSLSQMLLLSKINFVSPEAIPSICERIRLTNGDAAIAELEHMAVSRGAKNLAHYLCRFSGVMTTLEFLSTEEFGKYLASCLPKINKAQVHEYMERQRRLLRKRHDEQNYQFV